MLFNKSWVLSDRAPDLKFVNSTLSRFTSIITL